MSPDSPSVSVIVPTLNEEENIEGIVNKILAGAGSLNLEIIVVDDASRDQTQPIVRRLAETLPLILLARDKPKDGLAGAVLAGARAARAGVVLVIDADGSHPPEKIPELALPVINGERDMVIGSRYAPGGSTPGWSRKRRLMSRAASACAWPLTDCHDALSGFFAVRRDLLADIPSDAAGFKIALEILVRGGDSIRVGEVPIAFRDRELGQSKMGAGVIFTYFRRLLALSGWRESQDSVGLAISKTLRVWVVDFLFFYAATFLHARLGVANLIAFAAGAALNAWLKSAQSPYETRRHPRFLTRLAFVSLLALFLRSGVLGTCAALFGWPPLLAILPAIVTGWTVLFLGYALFIWPVREQYGRGVRWRVAAVGATAYLLALRVAFLFTLPIDRHLAVLPSHTEGVSIGIRLTVALRRLGQFLLGSGSRAGFNCPAILCWGVAAWAVFTITQRIFDKTTAFRALLLVSALPAFFFAGAIFSSATVLVTIWSLVLWLLALALKWPPKRTVTVCAAAAAIFWFPGGWLPFWRLDLRFSTMAAHALLFFPYQILLITPVTFLSIASYPWRADERRIPLAAASCSGIAALAVWIGWTFGYVGLTASAAIWLPLLPFIASEMQPPGRPPVRYWSPIISGCIVCYGLYYCYLAFA